MKCIVCVDNLSLKVRNNVVRTDKNMLSFEMQYDGRPDIKVLVQGFRKWLSAIEKNADKYDVNIIPGFNREPNIGQLEVTYDDKRLFNVYFYRKYGRVENGKKSVYGMFTVCIQDEGKSLMAPGERLHLSVDDHLSVNYLGKQTHIVEALQDVLPIRDEEQVKRIMEVMDIKADNIKMDSYQKRYEIDTPIPELEWDEDEAPDTFYKYVSLDVFHKILLNGTFRMNSIVSQSDTQETFYIGDLVCGEYEDEYKRFSGMMSEQKTLISSFTTEFDDAYMWNEYGDKGQGVCLGFRLIGERKLRQMRYVDEETTPLWQYKKLVDQLKKEGVRVYFTAIDDVHRFVKSDKFKLENEWRLVVEYDGEVDYDLYGNRCVSYKDFKFEGRDLPEIGLHLESIVIGPNQPEGTSNFPLLAQRAHKLFGEEVIVNRSKANVTV